LKVVAIGSRVFITSFQLAGVFGIQIDFSSDALEQVKKLVITTKLV